MRVGTPDISRYSYPDVSVVAGMPELDTHSATATLYNPCLLVEVLSKSTAQRDSGTKFAGYKRIPSLREYLLIDQYRILVTQWVRQPDGQWHSASYHSRDDVLALASAPAALPLHAVYQQVNFQS
jgi:Uma2 family endonuclease